jgi:large subunit ribosomal protein L20
MRKLWIARINAAARLNGTTYSQLVAALKKANITLNRKMLSDMAIREPQTFAAVVAKTK